MNTSKKRLNKIVALTLLATSIMTPVSAVITHVTQGTGAEIGVQMDKLLLLATHGSRFSHTWLHIHVVFGILFVVACIFHVVLNWRTLKLWMKM